MCSSDLRAALGYVKIGSDWIKEEEASRSGYFKYKGKWHSAKDLKNMGLVFHEGKWITQEEARAKGLVEHKGEWVTSREKERESSKKPETKEEKPTGKRERMEILHKMMKLTTPPGYWSKGGMSIFRCKST